jgi:site-specific recombinase XerD
MPSDEKSSIITHSYELSRPIEVTASDVARLRELAKNRHAANTRRAYRADWEHFEAWCASRGGDPHVATPTNVAVYLSQLPAEGFLYSSIVRASAGIMRELAKYDRGAWLSRPPEVQQVLRQLAKELGKAPKNDKRPMTLALLERGLPRAYPGGSLRELRNRALVLDGYFLASRRSELVGLQAADVDTSDSARGYTFTITRSKTDQEGEGFRKFVYRQADAAICPIRALVDWLVGSGLVHDGRCEPGPIFRELSQAGRMLDRQASDETVSVAVKEIAKAAGKRPQEYGAHSLRSGFVTDASAKGISLEEIAHQTGHQSLEQLRKYIKRLHPADNNPTEGFAARAKLTRR